MLVVAILALVVAILSAVFTGIAVRFAGESSDAAKKSAAAAQAADYRQRQPNLSIELEQRVPHDSTMAIYRIVNVGPADLDSVIVHQPTPESTGGTSFLVACTGEGDFAETAEVGPVVMGAYGRLTLCLGVASSLPEFRVKVVSWANDESWPEVFQLEPPRRLKGNKLW